MKDLSELKFPDDFLFSKEHEWVRQENGKYRSGISDYAQDQLGDVVYVELPGAGERFETGEVFGTVESVKAVSELFMPVSGEIVAINAGLSEKPDLVNSDPYGEGWMILVRPSVLFENLMTKETYLEMLTKDENAISSIG